MTPQNHPLDSRKTLFVELDKGIQDIPKYKDILQKLRDMTQKVDDMGKPVFAATMANDNNTAVKAAVDFKAANDARPWAPSSAPFSWLSSAHSCSCAMALPADPRNRGIPEEPVRWHVEHCDRGYGAQGRGR
jgi:hypothetical protein